jgi:hypothetical protein
MPAGKDGARKANQFLLAPTRAECFTRGTTSPARYHSDKPHRGGPANRLNERKGLSADTVRQVAHNFVGTTGVV